MIFTGGAPGGPYENPLWYLDDPDYNKEVADATVEFFEEHLTFTKGRWDGKPFIPFPWEEHRIIRPLFGILREPPSNEFPIGLRRIKKVYIESTKKCGKTELAAGIGNKGTFADFENNPEVYAAACDKKQATNIHGVASKMARNDDYLKSRCKIIDSIKRILLLTESGVMEGGYFEALSSDVPTKEGYNVHYVLFDELMAQLTFKFFNVLTEGSMTVRDQPIQLSITNSGWNQESVCWKEREYAVRWLNGEIENNAYLAVIFGMDESEDWHNEENWKAVNPSMCWPVKKNGKTYWTTSTCGGKLYNRDKVPAVFSIDDFREDYKYAVEKPYSINKFRQRRLGTWTNQEVAVINMTEWGSCGGKFRIEELMATGNRPGAVCYAGLDLSLTHDITACAYVFPRENEYVKVIWDLWLPEDNIKELIDKDNVPYDQWIDEGWITTTEGNIINYEFIKKRIIDTQELFELRELSYDPHRAAQIALQLQAEGIIIAQVPQRCSHMSEPTKRMLDLIKQGKFLHGDNPVVKWMAQNFSVITDTNENIRPNKAKTNKRIDGLVAAIIGLSGMILNYNEDEEYDPYAKEGPMVL